MGAILGAEGHLSYGREPECVPPFDYMRPLPTDDRELYYHIPGERLPFMFPLDFEFSNPRDVTSSAQTRGRTDFALQVRERDKGMCVVNGWRASAIHCDAAHLVAHSKGDEVLFFCSSCFDFILKEVWQYIEALTRGRRQTDDENDIIKSINSPRNGLFLMKLTLAALDRSSFAILRVSAHEIAARSVIDG